MNFTDHVRAAPAESRKHMAGKQILQFYAVSVKKKVKHCKFKTAKQIEAVGGKLRPEVCGDTLSRRSAWTSSCASTKDILRRKAQTQKSQISPSHKHHTKLKISHGPDFLGWEVLHLLLVLVGNTKVSELFYHVVLRFPVPHLLHLWEPPWGLFLVLFIPTLLWSVQCGI